MKFGETSEAAKILETELGTMLLEITAIDADLVNSPDVEKATDIYNKINKHTLGQLIKKLGKKTEDVSHLENLLNRASPSLHKRKINV